MHNIGSFKNDILFFKYRYQSANGVSAILPHIWRNCNFLRLKIWKIYSSFSLGHLRLEDRSQNVGHHARGTVSRPMSDRSNDHMYLKVVNFSTRVFNLLYVFVHHHFHLF
jgi:hypothetical protein